MRKIVFFLCLAFGLSGAALGAELKGGRVGCSLENDLEEIVRAAAMKNEGLFTYYLDSGKCVITRKGLPIHILETKILSGKAKVRVYVDNYTFDIWTTLENIKPD